MQGIFAVMAKITLLHRQYFETEYPAGVTVYSVGCEAYGYSAPKGRNYEQVLLQFRPFRAVCLLCIYIALTDYAIQFRPLGL